MNNLQVIRKKNSLTQEQLSRYMDILIGTIRAWEQNITDLNVSSFESVIKLCYILNCKPSDLFNDNLKSLYKKVEEGG